MDLGQCSSGAERQMSQVQYSSQLVQSGVVGLFPNYLLLSTIAVLFCVVSWCNSQYPFTFHSQGRIPCVYPFPNLEASSQHSNFRSLHLLGAAPSLD